ncbi:MAG: hypothetical protein A3D92_16330 [Bacteroidetes bacterium RIFCSPHIGHO2_02_FULL_44_7]|nr:MAG: hypothetical protein A3D92_16330 [Bacteroidetes bacterium RIFCSPHIGHO2_02_FULL_44_7]
MNRVIKGFGKFSENDQEEIYALYQEGVLGRATFPFQGNIADGVIFESEETTFLIPVSTIKASKFASTADEDEEEKDTEESDDNLDINDSDEIEDEE